MGEGSFSTSWNSLSRTSGNFLGRKAPSKMPPGPGPQPPPPLGVPGVGPAHKAPRDALWVWPRPRVTIQARS